jgi:hypothetical protein
VLDPNRPIREADIAGRQLDVRFVPRADTGSNAAMLVCDVSDVGIENAARPA